MSDKKYITNYSTPLPDYGDVFTIKEFKKLCVYGSVADFDGTGHPVRGKKMDHTIYVRPSAVNKIPANATHVIWFNK